MSDSSRWVSVHLHYEEPWERLLREAVAPLVSELLTAGVASRFFFVRYWERGPHLRLRFEARTEAGAPPLLQIVEESLGDYVRRFPSRMPAASESANREPPNSLLVVPYTPELGRYAGPVGLEIAEKNFCASSKAVLEALPGSDDFTASDRIGLATGMHIPLIAAMGTAAAREFFRCFSSMWWAGSFRSSDKPPGAARRMMEVFHRAAASARERIHIHVAEIITELNARRSVGPQWFDDWAEHVRSVHEELHSAFRSGMLWPLKQLPGCRARASDMQLWPFLMSIWHMTNNRIGVVDREEALLAYLFSDTLRFSGTGNDDIESS